MTLAEQKTEIINLLFSTNKISQEKEKPKEKTK